jgi:hypothetical protein
VDKQLVRDAVGWGTLLWLFGYVLGIILFMLLPTSLVGWVIMPVGVLVSIWVLVKKVRGNSFRYYLWLAVVWTLIAIMFDYFFLVKVFKPADGYYKLDVYLYYVLTYLLPLFVWWTKKLQVSHVAV